jgi:hypothetical protein
MTVVSANERAGPAALVIGRRLAPTRWRRATMDDRYRIRSRASTASREDKVVNIEIEYCGQ